MRGKTDRLFYGLVIVLFGLGLVLRWEKIRSIPVAMYYDEMDYVFTGEAVARYGTDITGAWNPTSLKPLQAMNLTAELPAVFQAAAQRLFGFGPENAHLVSAFFGMTTVILCMGLAQELFHKKRISLLTGGMMMVNPWHIHISRMAYEAPISIFFQVLVVYGFVLINKSKKSLTSIIVSLGLICTGIFGGFYTYHGAKFTIPALVGLGVIYSLIKNRGLNIKLISLVIPAALTIILLGNFIKLNDLKVLSGRDNEVIFNGGYISDLVNQRRRLSVKLPGKNILINKFTVLSEVIGKRYAFVFDVNRLFSKGSEDGFQFALFVFPYFYLSGAVFLVLGLIYLWKYHRYSSAIVVGLLVVAPVTSLISVGMQATFRSGLTYIIMLLVMSAGGYYGWGYLDKYKAKFVFKSGFILVVCAEVILFGGNYFGRYPVISADNHYFFERLLSGYVKRQPGKVIIYTASPYTVSRSLVAYLGLMPELSEQEKKQFIGSAADFVLGKRIAVTSNCPRMPDDESITVIAEPGKVKECDLKLVSGKSKISLGSPIDSRAYYYILNDRVCPEEKLPKYIYVNNIEQFEVIKMTDEEFCTTWMKQE